VRSVFKIPINVREGRDPFFPESMRVFQAAEALNHAAEITVLTVKGYSVSQGNPLVIINNHTFATGDEGDVLTPRGRVHVRCVEIHPNVVIVEINGQQRELPIAN
jgi:hypothetical protein